MKENVKSDFMKYFEKFAQTLILHPLPFVFVDY